MNGQAQPDYHILLIGIDAYAVKPLRGCVNDIDAIQKLLLGNKVQVPHQNIVRLASPHPSSAHETAVADKPATLANICAALEDLGSSKVKEGDRIFLYYSGHGVRTPISTPAGVFNREALVPVDFNEKPEGYQFLYDFDLNRMLAAIVARTNAVTLILDCCHSAGVTREMPTLGMTSRALDFVEDLKGTKPLTLTSEEAVLAAAGVRGIAGNVNDCQVVAACLNHELAQEFVGADGVQHGLLTRALVEQLSAAPAADLRELPWGSIWQGLRASVETANATQHLWMAGSEARAVIAGPRIDADVGLTIQRTNSNTYNVNAGTLADITRGAKIAVYKPQPLRFPPLGSPEDKAARFTDVLLEVIDATRSSATASAKGTPFDLSPGLRGRLVELGAADRLRCAVTPANDAIANQLGTSPLLEVVDEAQAQALFKRQEDGAWALVDDIHGAKRGYPVLCRLQDHQLDRAASVMEHYFYYWLPLRMAISCKDLRGALQIDLLRCPEGPAPGDGGGLPEVGSEGGFTYDLKAGDRVAIRVRNTSNERLEVTLLNAAASGKVEYLGVQNIDPKSYLIFWDANSIGTPFTSATPEGTDQGIDRLVAIGTNRDGTDLRYLTLDATFAEVIERTRDFKDLGSRGTPVELWTATQVVMRCRA